MKLFFYTAIMLPIFVFSQNKFEKAIVLFNENQIDASKNIFEKILIVEPNNPKIIEYLGDIEGKLQHWDKALAYYKTLKINLPNDANSYYKYGGALAMKAKNINKFKALGLIYEIKHSFEKAIVLNPNHIEARWALIELYLQLPGFVGGSESKAQKYALQLMQISKVDGYLAKGHIDDYFERFDQAEKNYLIANQIGNSKKTKELLQFMKDKRQKKQQ